MDPEPEQDWAENWCPQGQAFRLRYAGVRRTRFKHRFYTGPPGEDASVVVTRHECDIDLCQVFYAEEIVHSWYRRKHYYAVRVTIVCGSGRRELWTNARVNRHNWIIRLYP